MRHKGGNKEGSDGWTTLACRPDLRRLLGTIAKSINQPMSTLVDEVLVETITETLNDGGFEGEVKKAVCAFMTGRRDAPPQG